MVGGQVASLFCAGGLGICPGFLVGVDGVFEVDSALVLGNVVVAEEGLLLSH